MQRGIAGVNNGMRLAELLATRLCHDISGPVGTLVGALTMVDEDPAAADEAIELAADVAGALARRLRLLRVAWGGEGVPVSIDEIGKLCAGLPQPGRVKVNFEHLPPEQRIAGGMARSLLNVLLLAVESLPGGGTVVVAGDPAGTMLVRLDGPRAAWPRHFASWMADPPAAWAALDGMAGEAARGMQGPLTALVAQDCGLRLSFLLARTVESAPPLILSMAN